MGLFSVLLVCKASTLDYKYCNKQRHFNVIRTICPHIHPSTAPDSSVKSSLKLASLQSLTVLSGPGARSAAAATRFEKAKCTHPSAPAPQGNEICEASRERRKIFQGYLALTELKSRMQLAQSRLLVSHSVNERTKLTLSIISLKHLKPL